MRSADDMAEAVTTRYDETSVVIMAAAVSDFRPAHRAPQKLKKGGADTQLSLELVRNPDILEGLGKRKGGQILVGFAAETHDTEAHAREKLARKNLDLIVANDVTEPGAGFGGDTNRALLIDGSGAEQTGLVSKRQLAERILDRVAASKKKHRELVG